MRTPAQFMLRDASPGYSISFVATGRRLTGECCEERTVEVAGRGGTWYSGYYETDDKGEAVFLSRSGAHPSPEAAAEALSADFHQVVPWKRSREFVQNTLDDARAGGSARDGYSVPLPPDGCVLTDRYDKRQGGFRFVGEVSGDAAVRELSIIGEGTEWNWHANGSVLNGGQWFANPEAAAADFRRRRPAASIASQTPSFKERTLVVDGEARGKGALWVIDNCYYYGETAGREDPAQTQETAVLSLCPA